VGHQGPSKRIGIHKHQACRRRTRIALVPYQKLHRHRIRHRTAGMQTGGLGPHRHRTRHRTDTVTVRCGALCNMSQLVVPSQFHRGLNRSPIAKAPSRCSSELHRDCDIEQSCPPLLKTPVLKGRRVPFFYLVASPFFSSFYSPFHFLLPLRRIRPPWH